MQSSRIAFILEQSLGHVTHAQNLRRAVADGGVIAPVYIEPAYADTSRAWMRLPLVRNNWSVRASLAARLALNKEPAPDAAFFHSQVTGLFSLDFMRRVPSVVSLDATPLQYDRMGALYGHTADAEGTVSRLKKRWNERMFAAARHIVTWSEWAKTGLAEYGVSSEKVTVIPPGVDTSLWDFARERAAQPEDAVFRMLFVGGDFPRKGGETLLRACEPMMGTDWQLDIVTKSDITPQNPQIRVHHGLTPNSDGLRALFARADLFVFPTEGDCLPLAVLEALSAGLPIVATDVGAVGEAVREGVTGRIVPVGDAAALAHAIASLKNDGETRARMAQNARRIACDEYDAEKNYGRLVNLLQTVAAKGAV